MSVQPVCQTFRYPTKNGNTREGRQVPPPVRDEDAVLLKGAQEISPAWHGLRYAEPFGRAFGERQVDDRAPPHALRSPILEGPSPLIRADRRMLHGRSTGRPLMRV